MVMNSIVAGQLKSSKLVKVYISLHAEKTYANISGLFKRIVKQPESIAFALIIGMYAYGAESPVEE